MEAGHSIRAAHRPPAALRRRLGLLRDRPELILGLLVAVGVLVRLAAMLAVWPVGLGIDDSAPYTTAAAHNILSDVQAPGGYPAVLWLLARVSRQVAVTVVIQHGLTIVAALVFFRAVRRASGSPWVALVPAGGLLLDSDQIYLEHSIMAEGAYAIVLALTLYSAVRALERPDALGWALTAGLLAGAGALIRSAAIALVAVIVLVLALSRGWRRPRLRCALAVILGAALVLVPYAIANRQHSGELSTGPDPGWHLYGMVAHYADCRDFTPPPGTATLCQLTPVAQRPGLNFYLYDPSSPAQRTFGYFKHDAQVGAFAKAVVRHQFGAYLGNVALNLVGYFIPAAYPHVLGDPLGGQGLAHPLDWRRQNPQASRLATIMQALYAPIHVRDRPRLRDALAIYARVFRFGATLLVICTLLLLTGLVTTPRRAPLVLFGIGGLSLLVAPSVIGEYSGRYTVPLVAPMLAAAAMSLQALWERRRERRTAAGIIEPA